MSISHWKIPEKTFLQWNQHFIPSFDLFFLEAGKISYIPEDAILMPISEFQANPNLYTLDIRTTFLTWNIKKEAAFIAIMPDHQFAQLDDRVRQGLLEQQYNLNSGNIYEWQMFEKLLPPSSIERDQITRMLSQMAFDIHDKALVFLRHHPWEELPWKFRKKLFLEIVGTYNEDIASFNVQVSSFFNKYANRFPDGNGPNCFAAALAGITDNQKAASWIIKQWIHPDTFLMGLDQRDYRLIKEMKNHADADLQAGDVIAWQNKEGVPLHAAVAISEFLLFNKDGQTMFHPWLIRDFFELADSWTEIVDDGGNVRQYRKINRE